ncbi:hypothetical protein WA026_015048 [Henosepilachna vigintioctopunctata]|uniref:Uncharacterized protein n=1 Tax=Henosepilachna vigintioctopunctata TaxID=420089 RepID=A0AAW1U7B2_9CUCU
MSLDTERKNLQPGITQLIPDLALSLMGHRGPGITNLNHINMQHPANDESMFSRIRVPEPMDLLKVLKTSVSHICELCR